VINEEGLNSIAEKDVSFMRTDVLEREQIIPLPRHKTFSFFADAFNLELITPPFLRFKVITKPPVTMQAGTLLDYRLALFGMPFRWQTLIESWSPDESFVDTQLAGPYALWHHTHTFEALAPDRTLMRDRVLYRIGFNLFGRIAHAFVVKRMLKEIFDYRAAVVAELLTPDNPELDKITEPQFEREGVNVIPVEQGAKP
jgi:ligand-binding SRPBCC domain-containing protein